MRRLPGATLGVLWVVTWLGLCAGRPGWFRSFAQSSDAVNSAVILVWPLAAGMGAAQAVAARRGGMLALVEAWPGCGLWRLVRAEVGFAWLLALVGGTFASLSAFVVAAGGGSVASVWSLAGLVISCLGVLAALLWGWVAGLVLPSFLTAAALPIALYLVIWLLPAYTFIDPVSFTGATSLIGTAARLSPSAMVWLIAWQTASVLAAARVVRLIGAGAARSAWGRRIDASIVALLLVVAVALTILGPTGKGGSPWEHRGPEAWGCRTVGVGSTACLPRDLAFLEDEYFEAMTRADAAMRVLVGDTDEILSSQSVWASAVHRGLFIYVDTSLDDPELTWASYLMTYTASLSGPGADCFDGIEASQELWVKILRGYEVTDEQVLAASRAVAGC